MPGPHDALMKWTFGQPERAAEALKAILPRELAAAFDWPTLRVEPGSFVDEALKERHSDLLFSLATLGGGDARLYLLFEHQSTDDPLMAFRLLRYMVRIWEQVLAAAPTLTGLPIIVPAVLHTGPRAWGSSISFAGLFEANPELLEAATPYIPDFRFVLDDLGGTSDEELRKRAVDAVTRLVLIALRHGRRDLQDATVLEWVDLLEDVLDAPNGLDAARRVLGYILDVGKDVNIATLRRELVPRLGSRIQEVIVTEGERLRAEGRQEGRQQGRQEGRQEGRQQGMTAVLLRLLQKKFESVPEGLVQRVQTAPPDLLEKWTESILTAESLDEVFAS